MPGKIAYVFAEKKWTLGVNWIGISSDRGVFLQNPEEAASMLRELRKEEYEIIETVVPLEQLVYAAYGYRNLDGKDRERLAYWDAELEHREKYPGLFREELVIINELRQRGVKEGILWVSDVYLYPPGRLDYLTREMGRAFAPRTTYYLAAEAEPRVAGRICIGQYVTLIKYFAEALSLRNSTNEDARLFSGLGRPLDSKELDQIIAGGINVHLGI